MNRFTFMLRYSLEQFAQLLCTLLYDIRRLACYLPVEPLNSLICNEKVKVLTTTFTFESIKMITNAKLFDGAV